MWNFSANLKGNLHDSDAKLHLFLHSYAWGMTSTFNTTSSTTYNQKQTIASAVEWFCGGYLGGYCLTVVLHYSRKEIQPFHAEWYCFFHQWGRITKWRGKKAKGARVTRQRASIVRRSSTEAINLMKLCHCHLVNGWTRPSWQSLPAMSSSKGMARCVPRNDFHNRCTCISTKNLAHYQPNKRKTRPTSSVMQHNCFTIL